MYPPPVLHWTNLPQDTRTYAARKDTRDKEALSSLLAVGPSIRLSVCLPPQSDCHCRCQSIERDLDGDFDGGGEKSGQGCRVGRRQNEGVEREREERNPVCARACGRDDDS